MAERRIEIVEVAPRDGLQNEKVLVSTADKVSLIERGMAAGLKRFEATSFVNPQRVPQMADAEAVMAAVPRRPGVRLAGLALNERGVERAIAAGCDEIGFVVVASDTFNRRNQGVPTAETMAQWPRVAARAREAGVKATVTIGASFGCPFEGEVPIDRVLGIAETLLAGGLDELSFADTIGCGVPTQVTALLRGARALSAEASLRCHFHDTRHTGIANAYAAIEAGVDALDSAIGGFGGCPFAPAATGNIATEDLVYLCRRMGVATGVDLDQIIAAGDWLAGILGKRCEGALGRAGAFPKAA